jgi:hypothetical protein
VDKAIRCQEAVTDEFEFEKGRGKLELGKLSVAQEGLLIVTVSWWWFNG